MSELLTQAVSALKKNNFAVYTAPDAKGAGELVLETIVPVLKPQIVSYGDSMTMHETGVLDGLRALPGVEFIDTFEQGVERAEIIERRRRALLSDLFVTGSNAVTTDGKLVNLDQVGNRVGGIVFGPRHVVILAGVNKLVANETEARERAKIIAAPRNALRHASRTPCAKTGECMDCKSPARICNVWAITEKSWPKHRIHVVLIDEDLGL